MSLTNSLIRGVANRVTRPEVLPWLASTVSNGRVAHLPNLHNSDASAEADIAADVLLGVPYDHRFLFPQMNTPCRTQDYVDHQDLANYLANGIDVTAPRTFKTFEYIHLASHVPVGGDVVSLPPASTWWTTFWNRMAVRNCPVRYIGLDDEMNVSYWGFNMITESYWDSVYNDSAVQAARPSYMQPYTASDVWTMNHGAVVAFNRWADEIRKAAQRTCLVTYYNAAFGSDPEIVSDWNDCSSTNVIDLNGWEKSGNRTANVSSPEIYVGWYDWRDAASKDRFWNLFIRIRNNLCRIITAGGQVVPWIPPPRWSDQSWPTHPAVQFLQLEVIRHAMAMGIDKYIYWNPAGTIQQDDRDIDAVLSGYLHPFLRSFSDVSEISSVVQTGEVITHSEDYYQLWP